MTGFAFHAAPPPGEWLNDPNGLAFVDGRYVLYAQHSVTGPNGGDVGWGKLTSADLLDWHWAGVAIAPTAAGSAYSGSLVAGGEGIEAFLTRHDPVAWRQTQHRVEGPAWHNETPPLGPEGKNCRDPYVFHCAATGDWRMLVAEPCDWVEWRSGRSRLAIWASDDRQAWRPAGTIGPSHAPGVMWEVPVLIDFGGSQALILSLVDRRDDAIECSVRYWIGTFDGEGFQVDDAFPSKGLRLDHGLDFYAAIPNLAEGWPTAERVIVAWASNWRDARRRCYPGGARGGAITLPRVVTLADGRLRQRPISAADTLLMKEGIFADRLDLPGLSLAADRKRGILSVNGGARERVDWASDTSRYRLFNDAGLLELFIEPEGISVTLYRQSHRG